MKNFVSLYHISNFFENWIYPAYNLRNFLFHRYDLIKIKSIKPYDYAEPDQIMFEANMILIKKFIEEYNPEKHICWYVNNFGDDVGRKYGENENDALFPEYNGKYIMDIIKEIYNWYQKKYVEQLKDIEYIYEFMKKNDIGAFEWIEKEDNKDYFVMELEEKNSPKSIDNLIDVKWDFFDKHFDNRNDVLDFFKLMELINKIEKNIFKQKQKYLHLCIEVRPYLWT